MGQDFLQELKTRLRQFAAERDWDKFHSPKNLSMGLIAEAAEVVERFQMSWSIVDGNCERH